MRNSYTHSFRQSSSLGSLSKRISRHSLQVIRAFSGTNAVHASDEQFLLDLDWKPKLSGTQGVITWAVPITVCCLVYFFTAPAGLSIPYGTCIGVLFGLLLVFVRSIFMEAMYKAKEHMVTELGDPDSKFTTLENLLVHVKTKEGKDVGPLGVHCYHGFGSNTWSWSKVQQGLADKLGAVVTSHDMPGFGLTQRPTDLSAYLLSFNGRLGRLVLDHELAARGLLNQSDADKAGVTSYPQAHVYSTSSMESGSPPAAAAAGSGEEVASAKEVAKKAQEQGLDSAVPAATAAAAKGDIASVAKAGVDVVASALGAGSSSSSAGDSEPLAPTTTPEPTDAASFKSQQQQERHGLRRVLVGHSLGAVCAALEVIADPGKYSALVLVDPAIVAMGNGESGAAALHLEELHDDSSFTRSLASVEAGGLVSAALDAAAGGALDGVGLTGSSGSSSSRSSSLDLEAMAESAEMRRADSLFGGSSRTSGSGSSEVEEAAAAPSAAAGADSLGSGAAASGRSRSSSGKGQQQLLAAGEPVSYYATKGKGGKGAAAAAAEERGNLLFPLLERVQALLQAGFLMTMLMVISILRPVILVILRSAVRNRKFWKSGLQQAYYDKSKVDDEMVNAYRLPQLVKGWEDGMLQFLVARLGAGGPATSATDSPFGGLEDTRLAQRLAAVANANDMPVLIVHGQGDKMVPVQNSFRLAKMMKRGRVAVLKRSGHCPQEELPEAFSEVVGKFLSHVLKK